MSKGLRATLEWVLVIVLVFIAVYPYISHMGLSPMRAHQKSEASSHYGPSEILEELDFEGVKVYMCKYDKWFSADAVRKEGILWRANDAGGQPIRENEDITFAWNGSTISNKLYLYKFYGYVKNSDITKVTLDVEAGVYPETTEKTLEYTIKGHREFIFMWNDNEVKYKVKTLKGLDKDNKVLYENIFSK